MKGGRCFNWFTINHTERQCRLSSGCSVGDCTGKHHALLHQWSGQQGSTMCVKSFPCSRQRVSLIKVPVKVVGSNGRSIETYAFIDPGSDKTFVDEKLINVLGIKGKQVSYAVTSVHKRESWKGKEVNLHVCTLDGSGGITIPKIWTLPKIPVDLNNRPKASHIKSYPHLADISIPKLRCDNVLLLIGSDVTDITVPLEV